MERTPFIYTINARNTEMRITIAEVRYPGQILPINLERLIKKRLKLKVILLNSPPCTRSINIKRTIKKFINVLK